MNVSLNVFDNVRVGCLLFMVVVVQVVIVIVFMFNSTWQLGNSLLIEI